MKLNLLVLLLGFKSAFALAPPASLPQLVQSVPEGTDLAVPGIPDAKDTWVKMINSAAETIDIEQMYADGKDGSVLDEVIGALRKAGERKVKIRFILSKKMAETNRATFDQIKKIPGLELGIVDYGALTGGIQHAKLWIFDRKTAYIGSQNFDWKSLTQILETGVLFDDAIAVKQIQAIFDTDWQISATGAAPTQALVAPVTLASAALKLVASPPATLPQNVKPAINALTELLRTAKKIVRITVMDYSTFSYGEAGEWLELDKVLRETAARGVEVQLLVSHWNTEKPEIESIKKLSQVANVKVKVATIPDLPSGHIAYSRVNHSKIMAVDDEIFWVGTSNWSKGYFYNTRGIEIIMKDRAIAKQGIAIFTKLWNQKYTVPVDVNRDYPKPIK